jgi:hypothetical protein
MKRGLELKKAGNTDEPLKSLEFDHDILFSPLGQTSLGDDFEGVDLFRILVLDTIHFPKRPGAQGAEDGKVAQLDDDGLGLEGGRTKGGDEPGGDGGDAEAVFGESGCVIRGQMDRGVDALGSDAGLGDGFSYDATPDVEDLGVVKGVTHVVHEILLRSDDGGTGQVLGRGNGDDELGTFSLETVTDVVEETHVGSAEGREMRTAVLYSVFRFRLKHPPIATTEPRTDITCGRGDGIVVLCIA